MFKPGSIRKVEVTNFVYTEFYPGPNLNMIIGPNGTGKSTMVAAIILGLGGNPKIVGRGTQVSEYVKHDCSDATINIFLQDNAENGRIKITRNFNTQDKSVWYINNKKVILKDILEYIKQFNIQVNNLCQFLPQDRVQDFAKLNQQELLRETQTALCRQDLIEKQKLLIENRSQYNSIYNAIEKNNEKIQEAQDANIRLEGKVTNFKTKKKYLDKIQGIDRKFAWMQYHEFHDKLAETKIDINKASEIYEKHKNAIKPLKNKIEQDKIKITNLQHTNSNITRAVRDAEKSVRNDLEKHDNYKQTINKIVHDMNSKIAEIDQRNQEIELNSSKVEELKVAQRELMTKCGNDVEVKGKLTKIHTEIQKFCNHIRDLEDRKEDISNSRQNQMAQLRAYQNEINRLENVKQQRLDYLKRTDNDAYEAVLWYRNHKNLFKNEVYEPIMLELNVLDSKNAIYIENVIPMRDRIAFTCVDINDMNTLIHHLREEKHLTINILHSGGTENISSFQPRIPIEQLRRFGLYTYMHSLITAPVPIMRYLCKTYGIHNIPVGNQDTNKYFEQIPNAINVFFSDKYRFTVKFSVYTGEKSIGQNEIHSDRGLSISVDVLRLENVNGQINETQGSIEVLSNQLREFNSQIGKIHENISKLRDEVKYINSVKSQIQGIEGRITIMQNKIQEIRNTATNRDAIKLQANNKIQNVLNDIKQLHDDMLDNYRTLSSLNNKNGLVELKIEYARKNVAYLQNKMSDGHRLCQEAEVMLNNVKETYANIKAQARGALHKAKGTSKGFTPEDDGFDEFRDFYESLPSDNQELQLMKDEILTRVDCLSTADNDEMKEYENRLQLIKNLEGSTEDSYVNLNKITTKISKLEKDWLVPLNELISDIDKKFSSAFERMGCAGEISLNVGDDEKDYSKYGLCIKVTYRHGEPLQPLNNIVQSGGERAVATAAFMLSLQELTPVPFRCVDEINQGMDPNNERRIFELLVDTTGQENTSQYFLITPKLVPNLKFSRSMMVHIVHNGPFIEPDRKWSSSQLCNPQRVQIH